MLMAQRKFEYSGSDVYQSDYEERQSIGLKQKKNPTTKGKTKKRAASSVGFKSLCMMFAIIACFGLIGAKTVHTTVVKGAEIKALQKEIDTLNTENSMLQIEVDKLSSVARIEQAALAMGMEKPQGTIYIASNLIKPANNAGVENTQQNVAAQEKTPTSKIANIFKIFTSFFAITQR